MARTRRNAVYVPNDGYSRIRVGVRAVDRPLHDENRRAANNGQPSPHTITYRTLATVAGKQVERYKGTDFARAWTVADDWHVHIDRPNPGRLTSAPLSGTSSGHGRPTAAGIRRLRSSSSPSIGLP